MKIPPHAQKVFEGVVFDVYQWQQELFDGTYTTFEAIQHLSSVVIIPIYDDKTILINHEEQPGREPFMSFPAGGAMQGETPLMAAQRELEEETGHIAHEWIEYKTVDFGQKIVWPTTIFIARQLEKIGEPQQAPAEKIRIEKIPFETMLQLHKNPQFRLKAFNYELLRAEHDPVYRQELEKLLFE